MSIVERIQQLCAKKGTTLVGLERDLGIGRGIIRRWDTSSPNSDNLQKVADYFIVTTDYLLGRELNQELDPDVRAIARNMNNLSKEKRKILNELIKSMSDAADKELE